MAFLQSLILGPLSNNSSKTQCIKVAISVNELSTVNKNCFACCKPVNLVCPSNDGYFNFIECNNF